MTTPSPVEAIFFAALDKPAGPERESYLSEACRGDAELRNRVERLLGAFPQVGSFMDKPAVEGTGVYVSDEPAAGARIGHYKLLQKLGEGGMGTVWMAEQEQPVRRMVALKLVKRGMDSAQVSARFEAERQALALMEHPNIAKVLDAGMTETGRPYFVMELVKGVPITKFCDEHHLTPQQRLELFVPVCQAVQHAHQKGIIHRDLKPSNVMVALYDDKPVPKIIDFGVAKALSQRLTEKTMYTEFGALVGTLEYMSPEQAKLNALDIDTRSDVYSLGVILYELLAGSTPFDRKRLRQAALDEMLKIIREEEPPKPSTRLSTSGAGLPSLAALRGTEPAKLSRLMRGELDWIVMKALEKDRTHRYETANGLARDVQRFLADEAVEACPPSAAYRMRKFARKHRPALATAVVFAALLLVGTVVSAWQALRATRAEHLAQDRLTEVEHANAQTTAALKDSEEARKQAQAVSQQLIDVFRSTDPEKDDGRELKVVELLDREAARLKGEFTGSDATRAELLSALGETYEGLGQFPPSLELHQQALALRHKALGPEHPDTLTSMFFVADSLRKNNKLPEAEALHRKALDLRKATLGPDHLETITSMHWLGVTYLDAGRTADAIPLLEYCVAIRKSKLSPDHRDTLDSSARLAVAYDLADRSAEAAALYKQILPLQRARLGPAHPDTLRTMNGLANCYSWSGRQAEAFELFEDTYRQARTHFSPDHPIVLIQMANFSFACETVGQFPQALELAQEAYRRTEAKFGPGHPNTFNCAGALARAQVAIGQFTEAVALLEKTLELAKTHLIPRHPLARAARDDLARAYRLVKRFSEAQALYEENLRIWTEETGPDSDAVLTVMWSLATVHHDRGDYAQAEPLFRKALAGKRKTVGSDSPVVARLLSWLGVIALKQQKYAEAEPLLRECMAIRDAKLPDDWSRFSAQSLSGTSLLGQGKYAEAEPLLLGGYAGLKQRAATIPAEFKDRVPEALERLVQFYEATNKPDEAAKWKKELEAAKAAGKPPP